jgi:transposase
MAGRRGYPPEFKAEAVQLYRSSDRSIKEIASELGVAPESLRRWNAQQHIDAGKRKGLTTDDREELTRLRRENRRLKMERDILKKAAAFFANENTTP